MNPFSGKVSKLSFLLGPLLWVALFCPMAKAQEKQQEQGFGWLPQLTAKYKAFTQAQNPDKVYLHTDRTFYVAGDTIWCKAYLVDAYSLKPREMQEVLNISIYNAAQKEIVKQKVLAKAGYAATQVILPDSLAAGNYNLVAYTNWMKNAGEKFFFRKSLTLLNTDGKPGNGARLNAKAVGSKSVNLQFYPEGGALVNGLTSVVGFSAKNGTGFGIPTEGRIVDGTGKVVTTFKTHHAGIGSFVFRPETNKTYHAVLNASGAEPEKIALPVAQEKGVVLQVNNASETTLTVRIKGTPEKANTRQALLIQSRGEVYFSKEVLLNSSAEAAFTIEKTKFPDGIAQATLFNSDGSTEAERLFLINNRKQLNLKLSTNKQNYSRKETVSVTLEATDNTGKPVRSDFSLAVTDMSQDASLASNPNLPAYLLLSSDLTAFIEDAAYYFKNNDQGIQLALDNLLLTQRWNRFTWSQVKHAESYAPEFKRDNGLFLKGVALNKDAQPLRKALIYMLDLKSGKTDLLSTNDEGVFLVTLPEKTAAPKYLYQVWQQGVFQKQAQVTFVSEVGGEPEISENYPAVTDTLVSARLGLQTRIAKQYASGGKKADSGVSDNSGWLKTPADRIYQLSNYNTFHDVEEAVREIIPSVKIRNFNGETETRIFNVAAKKYYTSQPLYFVDGKPTFNNDLVLRMSADQVQAIDVYLSSNTLKQFGFLGNQGVIAIRTKNGNFNLPEAEHQHIVSANGVAEALEFTIPKITPGSTVLPDFRPVLYWNPRVSTDAHGRAIITFPASDAATRFRIEAQGISADGLPGAATIEFSTIPAQ